MWVREGHRWGGIPSPAVAEEGRGGVSSLRLGRVASTGLVSGSEQSHLLSGRGGMSRLPACEGWWPWAAAASCCLKLGPSPSPCSPARDLHSPAAIGRTSEKGTLCACAPAAQPGAPPWGQAPVKPAQPPAAAGAPRRGPRAPQPEVLEAPEKSLNAAYSPRSGLDSRS